MICWHFWWVFNTFNKQWRLQVGDTWCLQVSKLSPPIIKMPWQSEEFHLFAESTRDYGKRPRLCPRICLACARVAPFHSTYSAQRGFGVSNSMTLEPWSVKQHVTRTMMPMLSVLHFSTINVASRASSKLRQHFINGASSASSPSLVPKSRPNPPVPKSPPCPLNVDPKWLFCTWSIMKLCPDEVGRKWVVSVGASEAGSGIMMHSRDRDLLQDFAGSSTPTTEPWVPYSPQPTVGRRMSSFITSWMVISTSLQGWRDGMIELDPRGNMVNCLITATWGCWSNISPSNPCYCMLLWTILDHICLSLTQEVFNASVFRVCRIHGNRFGFWMAKSGWVIDIARVRSTSWVPPTWRLQGAQVAIDSDPWSYGIQWVMRALVSLVHFELDKWFQLISYLHHPSMHSPGVLLDTLRPKHPKTMRDLKTELEEWA